MTDHTPTLLKLAARCEKATGPDRELDAVIWLATTPGATRKDQVVKSSTGAWPDYTIDETRDASHKLVVVPAFTSSIDAAMTLVPEGWQFCVCRDNRPGFANVHQIENGEGPTHPINAATPSLALCSAAIEARAALKSESLAAEHTSADGGGVS